MIKNKKAGGSVRFALTVLCVSVIAAITACCFIASEELKRTPQNEKITLDKLPYLKEVTAASEAYGVDEARIYAVIQVESSFISDACSQAGALGLMQMMPSTYEDQCLALGTSFDPEKLKDPAVNIDICTCYLQKLYEMTGSWDWAHIAYNMGIGNVLKWQKEGYTPKTVPGDRAKTYLERIKSAYDAYSVVFSAAEKDENNENHITKG